jgi:hypothetical protein
MLGQAGPTALRVGSDLPATAVMRFDGADAGEFEEVALHEMLHGIGLS